MRTVALDLGGRKTDYCEVRGEEVVARGVVKGLSRLRELIGPNSPPARVAFEACREGWHVAQVLEAWGHEPVMVDTTRVKQLGLGQHGRKTNRIDAERLARALEAGRIPQAHILSPHRQELRLQLMTRRMLVEMRARCVVAIRGLAKARGERLPSCASWDFAHKVTQVELSQTTRLLIAPLWEMLAVLGNGITETEAKLEQLSAREPAIARLTTAPGVGPIVAAAFVSVVDEAGRFRNAHQVESYVGLVPSEDSTGCQRRMGSISKAGNSYLRALLVQAAWCLLRSHREDPLTLWGQQIARRRTKRIAVVALARRLTGILWAMWRDQTVYDGEHTARASASGLSRQAQKTEFQAQALRKAAGKQLREKRRRERLLTSQA